MQLEVDNPDNKEEAIALFQFHIGAIRRAVSSVLNPIASMFQFHIGAIRSATMSRNPGLASGVSIPYWCN